MATSRTLDLTMPDGTCDAVLATPTGTTARRSVLMVMDAIGVRPRLVAMAERMADLGCTVLLPNAYYRVGRQPLMDPALLAADRREERMAVMMPLLASLTPALWAVDGPVYLDHLERLAGGARPGTTVVGYCMGGGLGVRLASAQPGRVVAVAGFHPGGLVTDAPDSPHRLLDPVTARLVMGFADADPGATPEHQAAFAAAAQAAGLTYTGELSAGALHGFTMADLPAFDPAAEARHWQVLTELLAGGGAQQ